MIELSKIQRLDSLYHQALRKLRAHENQELQVVKRCDDFIARCGMEHFLNLLQEASTIERRGDEERVLSQQDVLTLKSCF